MRGVALTESAAPWFSKKGLLGSIDKLHTGPHISDQTWSKAVTKNDEPKDNVFSIDDGAESDSKPSEQSSELEALKAEVEDHKKKYLYLRADFDNFRKQSIKERSDLIKYGGEHVIREMLLVLDNMERALKVEVSAENIAQYKSGVELILSQFRKTLSTFGVEEVSSKGKPFDPTVQEALGFGNDPTQEANIVIDELRRAFTLHGKLIRPAQVIVNNPSEKKE